MLITSVDNPADSGNKNYATNANVNCGSMEAEINDEKGMFVNLFIYNII